MKFSSRFLAGLGLAMTALLGVAALAAAAPLAQGEGPIVIINRPPSNSSYSQGDIISVESVSASPVGIVQVDLLIDGQVVHSDTTPGDLPEVQFSLIQRWIANQTGNHVVSVRAIDSENRTGQASINVTVQANVPTPVPTATLAPPPTPVPCTLNAVFVRDVTIPDNTVVAPGAPFVKTWTIQNNGTCEWEPATVAVFIGGTRMAGPSPTPVGPQAPGATLNISINFVAPGAPGTYRSTWKLQSGSGVQFGQAFYVQVVIPGPPTPVPPPPTPQPPIGGCQGAPNLGSFTVDNGTIQRGQSTTIRWGFVSNADSVYLETPNGSGGVPTPGDTVVSPGSTSTYTLVAYCKGVPSQAQLTINVQGGGNNGGGGAQGSINGINVGNKGGGRWEVRVFYDWNGAGGPAQVCASAPGSDTSPCTNARSNAPYAVLNLHGKNIGTVTACLNDRSGNQVACGTN